MALGKSTAEVDAWLEVAQAGVREGANVDVTDAYEATLHVDCALVTTDPHTGTEIIVQIGTDTGNANANWSTLARLIGPIGTAVTLALNDTEAIGVTVLAVTDPIANNMDNVKKFKFIEHATDANSEIVYQISQEGDTTDTITIQDGLTNEQTSSSAIFDIDDASDEAVSMWQVAIPPSADRVRVLYNNNFDPNGSAVFTRARITKLTGI